MNALQHNKTNLGPVIALVILFFVLAYLHRPAILLSRRGGLEIHV